MVVTKGLPRRRISVEGRILGVIRSIQVRLNGALSCIHMPQSEGNKLMTCNENSEIAIPLGESYIDLLGVVVTFLWVTSPFYLLAITFAPAPWYN